MSTIRALMEFFLGRFIVCSAESERW